MRQNRGRGRRCLDDRVSRRAGPRAPAPGAERRTEGRWEEEAAGPDGTGPGSADGGEAGAGAHLRGGLRRAAPTEAERDGRPGDAKLGAKGHNHVLDADIRDYFGSIDHDKLMKLVEGASRTEGAPRRADGRRRGDDPRAARRKVGGSSASRTSTCRPTPCGRSGRASRRAGSLRGRLRRAGKTKRDVDEAERRVAILGCHLQKERSNLGARRPKVPGWPSAGDEAGPTAREGADPGHAATRIRGSSRCSRAAWMGRLLQDRERRREVQPARPTSSAGSRMKAGAFEKWTRDYFTKGFGLHRRAPRIRRPRNAATEDRSRVRNPHFARPPSRGRS